MKITSLHGDTKKLKLVYTRLMDFFKQLKAIAPQLSFQQCWSLILAKAMEKFNMNLGSKIQTELIAPA